MTQHPWNLTAISDAWSLRWSWTGFLNLNVTDDPGLRSVAVGSIGRASGHSDHVAAGALVRTGTVARHRRDAEKIRDDIDAAYWLTASAHRHQPLLGSSRTIALRQIADVASNIDPATARDVSNHLQRADKAARGWLDAGPDHQVLTTPPCPACNLRQLRARTSAPYVTDWPVICTAVGCRCAGTTCACGMEIRERGAPHIWAGGSPLAAAALTTPVTVRPGAVHA